MNYTCAVCGSEVPTGLNGTDSSWVIVHLLEHVVAEQLAAKP